MKTPHCIRLFLTIASVALTCAPAAEASQNVIIDGVTWSVNYTGDYLPNNALSDPAWTTLFQGGSATATVAGGILTYNSPANADQTYAEMANTAYWNGGSGGSLDNTTEFRMKLQSSGAPYDAAEMYIFDSSKYFKFTIHEDDPFTPGNQGYVSLGSGGNIVLDVDVYNTYRVLTFNDGTANLYINGVAAYGTPVNATGASATNKINFGDLSSGGGGVSDWDYVRWTNAGAFVPVPEPQTGVLILGGLSLLGILRRRSQVVA